jgi:hypothetical protein
MVDYDPLTALAESKYMRNMSREWVCRYPSLNRMALSIVSRRKMGSPSTVSGYVFGVRRFVEFAGYKDQPEECLEEARAGRLDVVKLVNEQGVGYIDTQLDRDLSNSTVHGDIMAVKKWLEVNGVYLDWKAVEMPSAGVSKLEDRSPTREELRLMLDHAPQLKDRLGILLGTSSGLRINTLLSLNVGDLNFAYPDCGYILVRRMEGRKFGSRVGRGENGSRKMYVSWFSDEAGEILEDYVAYRDRNGENVKPGSPLITGDVPGKRLEYTGYRWRYDRMLKRAGLTEKSHRQYMLHIHTLRKFFRSNCVGVDAEYREHWMGHKGGYQDASYFRAEEKRHLEQYRRALPHLRIWKTAGDSIEVTELRTQMEDIRRKQQERASQETGIMLEIQRLGEQLEELKRQKRR